MNNKTAAIPSVEAKRRKNQPPPPFAGVQLAGDNLFKTYRLGRVDVPVLKGASIQVKRGEWVAVLGASGSGKSTLLHLLGDLDQPDSQSWSGTIKGISLGARRRKMRRGKCPKCDYPIGSSPVCTECGFSFGEVFFDGKAVSSMRTRDRDRYRNRSIGFVFQFYHLLPELDVLKNTLLPAITRFDLRALSWAIAGIFFGGVFAAIVGALVAFIAVVLFRATGNSLSLKWVFTVAMAASTIGMVIGMLFWPGFAMRFDSHYRALNTHAAELLTSFGLGHRLKHRPRELSGGERQRVAIARALMNKPEVLLADEPTGNLDEKTGGEILDLIAKQHQQGLTIVMVTHDEDIARRADRVVRLHDGKVVEG